MKKQSVFAICVLYVICIICILCIVHFREPYETASSVKLCYDASTGSRKSVRVTNNDCTTAGCQYFNDRLPSQDQTRWCCYPGEAAKLVHTDGRTCNCTNSYLSEFGSNACAVKPVDPDLEELRKHFAFNARCRDNPLAYPDCGGTPPPQKVVDNLINIGATGIPSPVLRYHVKNQDMSPTQDRSTTVVFVLYPESQWFRVASGQLNYNQRIYKTSPVIIEFALAGIPFTVDNPDRPSVLYLTDAPASFGSTLNITWADDQSSITLTNPKLSQTWTVPIFDSERVLPFAPKPTQPVQDVTEQAQQQAQTIVTNILQSCFLGNAMVMMADGTEKRIDSVQAGDRVRSGQSGEAQTVLLVDIADRHNVSVVGIDHFPPFATSDHTFRGDIKRVCADVPLALHLKKWEASEVDELRAGVKVWKWENNQLVLHSVENITTDQVDSTVVYNLITEDHTYIVNGFAVNDDFPDVKRYPRVSHRILWILQELVKNGGDVDNVRDSCDYVLNLRTPVPTEVSDEDLEVCMQLLSTRLELVHLADELWEKYFEMLNE